MAKVTLYLDKRRKDKVGKYPLTIRLNVKNSAHLLRIGKAYLPGQWNEATNSVKGVPKSKRVTAEIQHLLLKAEKYLIRHELEVERMDIGTLKRALRVELKKTSRTPASVLTRGLVGNEKEGTLRNWSNVLIKRALASKRKGTADWYRAGVNALIAFNKGQDIQLIDIDESLLEDFKAYGYTEVKDIGTQEITKPVWKQNTIAGYMEVIRSIMNKAIREKKDFIPATHQPFKNVEVPRETIEVDSIAKADILEIRNLDFEEGTAIWKARARFMFMFNCQGLNFTDLAKLKIQDRVGNTISYYRAKTSRRKKRKQIVVALTKEAEAIWEYFTRGKEPSNYAFDILTNEDTATTYQANLMSHNLKSRSSNPAVTEKNRIKAKMKQQNMLLGEISEHIDCRITITTYDARYGWVNAALDSGISEELIGKGLGHSNLAVTRTYFEQRHKRTSLGELNELITQ